MFIFIQLVCCLDGVQASDRPFEDGYFAALKRISSSTLTFGKTYCSKKIKSSTENKTDFSNPTQFIKKHCYKKRKENQICCAECIIFPEGKYKLHKSTCKNCSPMKPFECTCGNSFKDDQEVAKHQTYYCSEFVKPQKAICENCCAIFMSKKNLLIHKSKYCHDLSVCVQNNDPSITNMCFCVWCKTTFTSIDELKEHSVGCSMYPIGKKYNQTETLISTPETHNDIEKERRPKINNAKTIILINAASLNNKVSNEITERSLDHIKTCKEKLNDSVNKCKSHKINLKSLKAINENNTHGYKNYPNKKDAIFKFSKMGLSLEVEPLTSNNDATNGCIISSEPGEDQNIKLIDSMTEPGDFCAKQLHFICPCGLRFRKKERFLIHQNGCLEKKQILYKCKLCTFRTFRIFLLKKHMLEHSNSTKN